ncbi:argininosuccinate synthase [Methanofollis fontis]|uniref:Argininosuccinate synthase n=1 Tax=Methanofollis fontis TaxID=2052832 RepID=A0A483CTB7_9EURY|nr:argininosuccinate synthase [Methanofollis fontis]TAJ44554.1 argininosuccinate synthase [Methanofollis fontis]
MRQELLFVAVIAALALGVIISPAAATTTEVHIVRYAQDGTTILNETTVDYRWMETNLPVLGDGMTHYYHQGPTFNESDIWDAGEYQNVETRDFGAVQGTSLSALCDLVGGMNAGDTLRITAEDGFYKNISYETVYGTDPRKGTPGLAWYAGEESFEGDPQGTGYVPAYYNGLRLIFFADTSSNPWGWHVFGNTDMRETLPEEEWHLYNGKWPSTSGLSVKTVSDLEIIPSSAGSAEAPATTPAQSALSPIVIITGLLAVACCARR